MVFHPARRVASSHGLHDHSLDFVCLFSGWLRHLSCAGWREVFGIHLMARRGLLPDAGFARSSGIFDVAAGDSHGDPGLSGALRQAPQDRALDFSDLALRLGNGRARLFHALPVVSARGMNFKSSVKFF